MIDSTIVLQANDLTVFTEIEGAAILAIFAAIMSVLTYIYTKREGTKEGFLLADRELTTVKGAFSITASWVWAPALLVSAEIAYQYGLMGLVYFSGMNTITFFIMGAIAVFVRKYWPREFTLPGLMKNRHSSRVQYLYLFQFLFISVLAFVTQLSAGGIIITFLTGIPLWQVTIAITVITLAYSLYSGLESSVITDWIQMIFLLIVGVATTVWVIVQTGIGGLAAGMSGTKAWGTANPFSMEALLLFWFVGLTITITHFSGMVSDQSFWQRAWALDDRNVGKSFALGGVTFIFIPASMGTLGLVAAGQGFVPTDVQRVNLELVVDVLPSLVALPFTVMLMSGLMSTLDSQLNSVGSLIGHDFSPDANDNTVVRRARLAMIGVAAVGLYLANFGIPIIDLFLFFGAVRAVTVLPTWLTVLKANVTESGMFNGIAFGMVTGIPFFGYVNFAGLEAWTPIAMLYTLLVTGIFVLAHTAIFGEKTDKPSPARMVYNQYRAD